MSAPRSESATSGATLAVIIRPPEGVLAAMSAYVALAAAALAVAGVGVGWPFAVGFFGLGIVVVSYGSQWFSVRVRVESSRVVVRGQVWTRTVSAGSIAVVALEASPRRFDMKLRDGSWIGLQFGGRSPGGHGVRRAVEVDARRVAEVLGPQGVAVLLPGDSVPAIETPTPADIERTWSYPTAATWIVAGVYAVVFVVLTIFA